MKKFGIVAAIAIVLILVWWGFQTAGSDYYNYKGYVTSLSKNEKGQTVLTTISGTKESEFTLRWYTKKKAPVKEPFRIGDRVMLTSAGPKNDAIRKIKVSPGYSTKGKVVYLEGVDTPFVLATLSDTKDQYLVRIEKSYDTDTSDMETGDLAVFYHEHAAVIRASEASVVADAASLIGKGTEKSLSPEEIDFIKSLGYSLKR